LFGVRRQSQISQPFANFLGGFVEKVLWGLKANKRACISRKGLAQHAQRARGRGKYEMLHLPGLDRIGEPARDALQELPFLLRSRIETAIHGVPTDSYSVEGARRPVP
jgi:hypothetical protein